MKIYHYTTIDVLALILKNLTLRFTRLDHVDVLEEAKIEQSQYDLSKFLFVSCWTENGEESLPKGLMNGIAKVRVWLYLPLNPLRMQELTENYVSSNAKIKKALGIEPFPCDT